MKKRAGRNEVCPCGSGRKYKKCCIPASNRPASNSQLLPRHHLWRKNYRLRRYLEQVSDSILQERANDVFSNMVALNEQRKYSPPSMNAEGQQWMILWTHILEECALRKYPYPDGLSCLKEAFLPKHDWPGLRNGIEAFKSRKLKRGADVLKYGQSRYLLPLVEKGLVRIAPASIYNDSSLNHAIKDSELEISFKLLSTKEEIKTVNRGNGQSMSSVVPIDSMTYRIESHTNYYVYCLASSFSPRLFGDFEVDSCVIIHRPKAFIKLLQEEFDKKLSGWQSKSAPVTYIDPFHVGSRLPDIFFSKHFRFAYQKESRIVWIPPEPTATLEPIFLEVGSLSEYCEIISLLEERAA